MRLLTRRRVFAALAIVVILIVAGIGGVMIYLDSPAFEERARRFIVQEIERTTGTKVTLGRFAWSFWQQRIRLENLTLRGLEPADRTPLAHIARIDVGLNFRTLLQRRRLDLHELTITQPEFHIVVYPDGTTNIPSPQRSEIAPIELETSIQNFNVLHGSAILNERRINVDLSLTNLAALLDYHPEREVLETHVSWDGVLDRSPDVRLPIPYMVSADVDYTRETLVVHRMTLSSGRNEAKLQGKINQALSSNISGKLDYAGSFNVNFLNYFFEAERFAGRAAGAGFLEFSRGMFFTQGHMTSDAVDYAGWRVTELSGDYSYRFPDRRLAFRNFKNSFMKGSVGGDAVVENLPGRPRVLVNVKYSNIDAAGLTRAYPWDPKYRIFSNATGLLNGWFEGKLARFEFSGNVDLKSYAPPADIAGIVPLPLDGSTDYTFAPRQAQVFNADGRFQSTTIKAAGLIHSTLTDLNVSMSSSDLKDLAFLYPDANGSGTFNGTVKGQITTPVLEGEFTLNNHTYRQWTIQEAGGGVRLDLAAENAALRNVSVKQGNSEIMVTGTSAFSGSPVDLRVQSSRVEARDIQPFITFINRKIGGVFGGDVRVSGLTPTMRVEGDVRAENLSVDDRLIGTASGHVRYAEPVVELDQLTIRQAGSTLTGRVSFNRVTEAVNFTARVNSVNLETFRPLGLPEIIKGVVRQADIQGGGTLRQPNLKGTAVLQDLSVNDEVFPEAQVVLASTGTQLAVDLTAGKNLSLNAQVDTAATGYPFTARATFTQYPIERIAKFSGGSFVATGNADLQGVLADSSKLSGNGRIENAEIRIQDTVLRPAQSFNFQFNTTQLTVSNVTLTGESTKVTLEGTIGLRDPAPLNLTVVGQVDLKLIEGQFPQFVSSGIINVRVDVRGTTQAPDLRGNAVLSNASLRRAGLFTGLTNVNGTLSFNQNQIRINSIEGAAGGGTVHAEGVAVLQNGAVQGMNVQIDATNVRLRGFPEGLRTVINARTNLQGSLASPLLEGNVQIQSLAYRSSFEDFLAMLKDENLGVSSSPYGAVRLSLQIEGGRNITIQNELAEVEARVELNVKGTVDEPSVTGHVEASGGTLIFQGNRYTVTRGNIDFVDQLRIRPVIDIEAESQLRDYRVILSITGRGDNPKLAMRSDPPLPELEIVSLIAGGRTRSEIARAQQEGQLPQSALPTSEQLFQSGAASILFDLLQQRVGNRLGLLGTGRVRIDPFLVGTGNNQKGARLTLSEQVTKDLSVTYSHELSSTQQQVIQIEYFIGRNTSVVASRDEFGNFGLDIRHRTRLK